MSNNPYAPAPARRADRPTPECTSNPPLFESERPEDHEQAKVICASCPIVAECEQTLQDTIKAHGYGAGVGPRGTWAGKLYAPEAKRRDQRRPIPAGCGEASGTPNGYARHKRRGEDSCEPCREARAAQRRAQYAASKGDAA